MEQNGIDEYLGKTFSTNKGYKIKVVNCISVSNIEIEFEHGYRKKTTLRKLQKMINARPEIACYSYTDNFIKSKKLRKRIGYIIFTLNILQILFFYRIDHFIGKIVGMAELITVFVCPILFIFIIEDDRNYEADSIYVKSHTLHFDRYYNGRYRSVIKHENIKNIMKIVLTKKWIKLYGDTSVEHLCFTFHPKKIKIPNHIEKHEEFLQNIECVKVKD